jgi:hypothetical protein
MKPKRTVDVSMFSEQCQSHVREIGGRAVCVQHPGGSCRRDVTTTSEARAHAAAHRARVLQEEWRQHFRGTDVRTLVPEGARMVPMSTQEADQVLAKHGLTRPRDTRPLALAESAPHENTRKLQDAREAAKRGTPSAVATLLERLDRVPEPSVEAARDLARRRLGGRR